MSQIIEPNNLLKNEKTELSVEDKAIMKREIAQFYAQHNKMSCFLDVVVSLNNTFSELHVEFSISGHEYAAFLGENGEINFKVWDILEYVYLQIENLNYRDDIIRILEDRMKIKKSKNSEKIIRIRKF